MTSTNSQTVSNRCAYAEIVLEPGGRGGGRFGVLSVRLAVSSVFCQFGFLAGRFWASGGTEGDTRMS
jgi:hypothetical protein